MSIQDIFKEADKKLLEKVQELDTRMNEKVANYMKFIETGDIGYLKKQMELIRGKDQSTEKSFKENVEPNSSNKRSTRQNSTLMADTNHMTIPSIRIKMEKMSLIQPTSIGTSDSNVISNEAPTQDMPAPTMLPSRKKKIKEEHLEPVKRSTRTKTRMNYQEKLEVDRGKPSDVIIQNTTVTMIDITDDKESDKETMKEKMTKIEPDNKNETTRSTRTKTRQQKKKAEENGEVESKDDKTDLKTQQNKQTKIKETAKTAISNSPSDKVENTSAQTEYEDAMSNLECNNKEEAEIQSTTMAFNKTVVVEVPKIVQKNAHSQDQNDWKTPPKTKSKKAQIQEIFSPFDKTSLKKKVEAFEKLGSGSKTSNSTSKIPLPEERISEVKTKSFTPFASKFVPKSCSTTRINKLTPQQSSGNDSCLSMKTLSALKASQAEYREREKRRQEKEQEAQLKKEALLQAQAEEKRRKREEKQLKAQQQREMLQKEKEKLLEMQKLKQEKHKQVIAEKEEKLQKTREEAEKKRLLAKNKAKLAKQSESSDVKVGENSGTTKRAQLQNHTPIYMLTKAPLLPTEDCYDSDDDANVKTKYVRPQWSKDEYLKRQLYTQLVAGEKIKNSLFCCQSHSPDLIDIFETIDPKKLKRTSSAIWRKPPRYTLFSMTSDIQFSEDSDEAV